jgi:hypothetical protein
MSHFPGGSEPMPAFPASIHHHQNNSFDEFREGGYARAHYLALIIPGVAALKPPRRAGVFVLIQGNPRGYGKLA